jgi:hypothetical protein
MRFSLSVDVYGCFVNMSVLSLKVPGLSSFPYNDDNEDECDRNVKQAANLYLLSNMACSCGVCTVSKISAVICLSDNDLSYYVNIRKLLDSSFSIRWEPKSPYWRSP